MASYNINLEDGTLLVTVNPGEVNNSATPINLVGQGVINYGELIAENFVNMLENFARPTTPPANSLAGQLWWNNNDPDPQKHTMNVVIDSTTQEFKQFVLTDSGGVSVSGDPGTTPVTEEGNLKWFENLDQLYASDGGKWVLVGPASPSGAGSGSVAVQLGPDWIWLEVANDEVVAAWSPVNIPSSSLPTNISFNVGGTEFTGINLQTLFPNNSPSGANGIGVGGTLSSNNTGTRWWGTASNADRVGGQLLTDLTSQFIDAAGDTMTGDLNIDTTGALTIPNGTTAQRPSPGDQGMIRYNTSLATFEGFDGGNWRGLGGVIDVDQDTYIIAETSAGADNDQLQFYASNTLVLQQDQGNSTFTSNIVMSGHNINAGGNVIFNPADPTAGSHVGDRNYNDLRYVLESGDTMTGNLTMSGATIISENIRPDGNNTRNIGTGSLRYNTVFATTFNGTATSALYADVAERYYSGTYLEPGTIVRLGGENEIEPTNKMMDIDVFGVVSTNPALRMNETAGDDTTHPFIAFTGRVPVKVVGTVKKGQRLVSSSEKGVAEAIDLDQAIAQGDLTPYVATFGRALEDKDSEEVGVVEAIVGAK
jgi:hypothetical protein